MKYYTIRSHFVMTNNMFVIIVSLILFINTNLIIANERLQHDVHYHHHHRQGKFWDLGVVRFENGICNSTDYLWGTCYTKSQCSWVNGIPSGPCASGIGTCCVVQTTCGDTTSNNNTYFVNPNFPNNYAGGTSCTLTIQKCDPDICQIRIEFNNFNLAQPDGNGYCVYDAMYVTGSGTNVPVICGENSGQHIYADFNGNSDIQITIETTNTLNFPRSWNLKISQIACDCPTKAPAGCLMYYTSPTGTVKSFNYGRSLSGGLVVNSLNETRPGTRELANLNYGVCVEQLPGYCSIEWSQAPGDPYSFTVTNDTVFMSIIPGLPSGSIIGQNCTTDFVVIPNPYYVNGTAVRGDRFCGNMFPTVITSSKPFVLTVVTNSNDMDDVGNRGFCLNYREIGCSNLRFNRVF